MKGPETLHTSRLILRRPNANDAEAIFTSYAGDPAVTRFLSWPTHRAIADTQAFLRWSGADWDRWPAGSYLVFLRLDGRLLGGTGLSFNSETFAATGYVLAKEACGHGYATESLHAMVNLARELGVPRLEAICHVDHRPSAHVMEKCGFKLHSTLRQHTIFPNLDPELRLDVLQYMRSFSVTP
jgi:ribosomal-protein-alanine N-acetyltransferase